MKPLPLRYQLHFKDVQVEIPELGTVATSVGPRGYVGWRWECKHCGKRIKPNNAGAQSHIAFHVRRAKL